MRVALVGPCSPADIADLMDDASRQRAVAVQGYRGVPVADLARSLVAAGYDVSVATLNYNPEEPAGEYTGPRFSLRVERVGRRPRQYFADVYAAERRALASALRDAAPDVINAHWTYEFELAAQDSRLPHVTTAHDSPVSVLRHVHDAYRAARLLVAARARMRITSLSAVSPYTAERWRREMGYRKPIRVIPNAIPQDLPPLVRAPLPHPTLLEVADAGRLKNVEGLLRAFALVRRGRPDAELRVVGPGLGPMDPLAGRAREEGLAEGVTFVGPVARRALAEEYARAWLLVHASLEESFGLTLLEAHRAGLPILGGRRSGAVPYVLDNGRAGRLTDVRDPATMARDIAAMISEGPPVQPAEVEGFVKETFSPEVVVAAYLDWYQEVLDRA